MICFWQSNSIEEACAVCLENPSVGDTIRHLPCFHKFHKEVCSLVVAFHEPSLDSVVFLMLACFFMLQCIDEWLRRKKLCPICKSGIRWSGPPNLQLQFYVGCGSDERLQFLVPAASVPIPAVRLSLWCIVKVAGLIASFCRRTPCNFSCYIDSLIGIMDEVNHPLSRYDIVAWFSLWANCSFFCASTACGGWCELTHMHVHVHVSVVDVWRDCCLGRHLLVSAGGESETGETNKLIDVHISWHLGIPSTTFKQQNNTIYDLQTEQCSLYFKL